VLLGIGTVFLLHRGHISRFASAAVLGLDFDNVRVPVITFDIAVPFLFSLDCWRRWQLVEGHSQEPLHHELPIVGALSKRRPVPEESCNVLFGKAVTYPKLLEDLIDRNDRHARGYRKLLIEQFLRLRQLPLVVPNDSVRPSQETSRLVELVDPPLNLV